MGKKLLYRMTFRKKLIAIFLPLVLIPLMIVSLRIYEKSKGIIQNNVSTYTQEYLNQLSNNIEYKINEVIKISAQLTVNTQLNNGLVKYHDSSADQKTKIMEDINNIFSNTLSVYGDVNGIYVFDNYNNEFYAKKRYIGNSDIRSEEWYQKAISNNGKYILFIKDGSKKTIGVARSIINIYTKQSIGVILVDLPYTLLDKSIKSNRYLSDKNGVIYILDQEDEFIYTSEDDRVLTLDFKDGLKHNKDGYVVQRMDGNNKFIVYHTSEALNWRFVYICDMKELMKDMNSIRTTIFSICCVLGIISIALAVTLSTYLLKPFNEIIQAMKKVEKGDYSVRIQPKTNDEIKYLMLSFNNMTDHIEKLIQSEYSAKLSQKEAQLDMLQQQINPHFLYNTFESLRGLAITEGNKEIANMVKALSNFMRYNLYRGKSITTVEEELNHIKNYIIIQNYRYDDKVALVIDINEEIRRLPIPKFTLQPLVENAILHGIIAKKEKGLIHISSIRYENYATIIVHDNGVGMKAESVNELNWNLQNHLEVKRDEQTNIGTFNVNERLKLNFGKDFGLAYTSTEGVETTVEVRLPLLSFT